MHWLGDNTTFHHIQERLPLSQKEIHIPCTGTCAKCSSRPNLCLQQVDVYVSQGAASN